MFEKVNITQNFHLSQLGEEMHHHVADVFEALLSLPIGRAKKTEFPASSKQVSALVGIAGESVAGTLCLNGSERFSQRASAAMLGHAPDDFTSQAEVNQVMGEITNMLAGGLKSWLRDSGVPCTLSAPSLIRGAGFTVEPMPEMTTTTLCFECIGEPVLVEIQLKLV